MSDFTEARLMEIRDDLMVLVALAEKPKDYITLVEVVDFARLLKFDLARAKAGAAALRRRVRLARATFYAAKTVARAGTTDIDAPERLVRLLDLRRPLPPRQKRHGGGRAGR